MTPEWTKVKISEVCDMIVDCVNKTAPQVEYKTAFKMIRTPQIKGGRIDRENCRYVERETFEKWTRRARVLKGDVLLTREAPMGEIGYVDFDDTVFLGQRIMQYRVNATQLDSKFLLYSFLSPVLQNQFRMHEGSGSVVSHIRVPDCLNFELSLPPLDLQRKIAKILGDLDDKIELNRKTNQTLEQIAQALFKSWFVDFEPTRAKIAAKEAGASPEEIERAAMCAISGKTPDQLAQLPPETQQNLKTTAALFPDALVDSELGEVPEGWEVKPLSAIIEIIGGGTPKRSEESYWNGDIPWFSVRDVPASGDIFVVDTEEKISELGLQKSSTKLLPVGTTIISARGTVGKLALVATPMCMNQSCYGIRGKDGFGSYFNYFNLREAVDTLLRNVHGAVFDTITTQTFESYSMAVSVEDLTKKFDGRVEPLLKRIELNVRENIVLSNLRDTLLPKLLSSELAISEEFI